MRFNETVVKKKEKKRERERKGRIIRDPLSLGGERETPWNIKFFNNGIA